MAKGKGRGRGKGLFGKSTPAEKTCALIGAGIGALPAIGDVMGQTSMQGQRAVFLFSGASFDSTWKYVNWQPNILLNTYAPIVLGAVVGKFVGKLVNYLGLGKYLPFGA